MLYTSTVDYLSNAGFNALFDNMYDWNGIQQKAQDVNDMNAYITNDETAC
jgi:hypothetical protein